MPAGVEDEQVRQQLLDEFNIEISGGFGPLKGKMWRIGLMGYSSQKTNVLTLSRGARESPARSGFSCAGGRRRGGGDSQLPAVGAARAAGATK